MPDGETNRPHYSGPTARPANVRMATAADEHAVMAMLLEGYEENGFVDLDAEKMQDAVAAMLRPDSGAFGMIGVIDGDGEPAGSVGLVLSQLWYSSEYTLGERWSYVRPKYRESRYAVDLIDFSKWASDQFGVALEMGIVSTYRTEAKVRLYRRHLKPIGAFFAYGIERANGPLALDERVALAESMNNG
jgi:hypothetical protein